LSLGLLGAEIAQGVGEITRVGDLVLPCSGDVLNEIGQEIHRVGPGLAGAVWVLVVHLAGALHVAQPLEGKGRAQHVTQDPLDIGLMLRHRQWFTYEDREP
jgi:hypothetical protein